MRPDEASTLQPRGEQAQPVAVKPENLDQSGVRSSDSRLRFQPPKKRSATLSKLFDSVLPSLTPERGSPGHYQDRHENQPYDLQSICLRLSAKNNKENPTKQLHSGT